ncbi:diguanylate cyclase [Bacillus sp. JCM 19034]|uniref:histidine kinase N-terminal 7TM domain-containing diguanylate cyclase n=1 Tax=Bacillus sp. JCM 19034 TaxID=1481928 RepID=UPI0007841253|nr:diguanylate cyclase [Bacillus sp. JCM 19034]
MNFDIPYLLFLIASSFIFIILIIFALSNRHVNGAFTYALLISCAFIWLIGYTLEIIVDSYQVKVFWKNVTIVGVYGSVLCYFIFALQYSEQKWRDRKFLSIMSLPIIVALFLIWTNDWHNLFHTNVQISQVASLSTIKYERTLLNLLFMMYAFILVFISFYILFRVYKRTLAPFNRQYSILMVGFAIPVVTMLFDLLNVRPLTPFSTTSVILVISGLFVAWGLFRQQALYIWPIARDQLVENMKAGVIVTDITGKLIDRNPAAIEIAYQDFNHFNLEPIELGQNWYERIKQYPQWNKSYSSEREVQIEISPDSRVYYEVSISPLKNNKGQLIGHLTILIDITSRKWTEKRLFIQATTDYLTKVHNRRHFFELSRKTFATSLEEHKPLSLLMIDIDFFKSINDTYGHTVGDRVLQEFAIVCKGLLKEEHIFGRIGGEEFAITLPNTSLKQALQLAKVIQQTFSITELVIENGSSISLTVSIGVASKSDYQSFDDLFLVADQYLYDAKEERNTIKSHSK